MADTGIPLGGGARCDFSRANLFDQNNFRVYLKETLKLLPDTIYKFTLNGHCAADVTLALLVSGFVTTDANGAIKNRGRMGVSIYRISSSLGSYASWGLCSTSISYDEPTRQLSCGGVYSTYETPTRGDYTVDEGTFVIAK